MDFDMDADFNAREGINEDEMTKMIDLHGHKEKKALNKQVKYCISSSEIL